mmetsp:Transcript_12895/g.36729  ORF Transcript_12895/g.36729 Transcript_12895/m.36729 type:complete len:262 (-) Transcript_12895:706-1491(-)
MTEPTMHAHRSLLLIKRPTTRHTFVGAPISVTFHSAAERPNKPTGRHHNGRDGGDDGHVDSPVDPVAEEEDWGEHHRLRRFLPGELVPSVHIVGVLQETGVGTVLDGEEPAQVLPRVLLEVPSEEVLWRRAPRNLLEEAIVLGFGKDHPLQASPPVRDHGPLEGEGTPELERGVVLLDQEDPAGSQHLVHAAPSRAVELPDEESPRKAMQRAVHHVRGERQQQELGGKPSERLPPRLVRAPIEQNHLRTRAHVVDVPKDAV